MINPARLGVVDFLNQWGLVLIGVAVIAGLLTRYATIAGILILALYYFSTPPFVTRTGSTTRSSIPGSLS